ncbi:MAG: YbdK family carboxylate-amine ligase [Candidatus Dormibacteria bacterium]
MTVPGDERRGEAETGRPVFSGSPHPTVGMEVEIQLVDAGSVNLVDLGPRMLAEMATRPETADRVRKELMQNTVEVATGPRGQSTVAAAREDLRTTLEILDHLVTAVGGLLVSAGSHPFADPLRQSITHDARIERLVETIQDPARRLQTYGLHVHVGVPEGDTAIRVQNALVRHFPELIALSASSPFWEGRDTGLQSTRCVVFADLPLTGLPPRLESWGEYEALYGALVRAGRIESHKDLHLDVRPSPALGTVELRVCDAPPTLREMAAIAAFTQCLVAEAVEGAEPGDPLSPLLVKDNKDLAVRYGLEGRITVDASGRTMPIAECVAAAVRRLAPLSRRLHCPTELADVLSILETGPSSSRQRTVYRGAASDHLCPPGVALERAGLAEVVRSLAAELRSDTPGSTDGTAPPGVR